MVDVDTAPEAAVGELGAPVVPKLPKPSAKALAKLRAVKGKKGVVYISRVPPHMKPQKIRHLLEQHAELGRVYLAPEDEKTRKLRKKRGGGGRSFTEGWVEFADKTDAKRVCAMLNGQCVGGKRHSAYASDLWTLKYLPKFSWDDLLEEIEAAKARRERRMDEELAAAKRERDFYLGQVDKAKGIEAMRARRGKREAEAEGQRAGPGVAATAAADVRNRGGPPPTLGSAGAPEPPTGGPRIVRAFGQRRVAPEAEEKGIDSRSRGILALVAGKRDKRDGT